MARKFPRDDEVMGFTCVVEHDSETGEKTGRLIGAYYTLVPETTDVVSRGMPFAVSKAQLKRMTKLATSKHFVVCKPSVGIRECFRVGYCRPLEVETGDGTKETRWYFKKEYCWKCGGTGLFRWKNRLGQPCVGACFHCKHTHIGGPDDGAPGKGYITPEDSIRTERYHERRAYAAYEADMAKHHQ